MRRATGWLLVAAVGMLVVGCAKRGTIHSRTTAAGSVSLEAPPRARVVGSSDAPDAVTAAVFPARYSEEVLPEFPEELLGPDLPPVTVRVRFRIGVDGRAHDATAGVSEGAPEPERFASVCREVVEHWRFSPAWRLAVEGERDDDGIVPVESKGYLTFRFDVDRAIEVTFGP